MVVCRCMHEKGSTLALNPRADATRSPKQGYQWSHEKDLYLPKIFGKKMCADIFLFFDSHICSPLSGYTLLRLSELHVYHDKCLTNV